MTMIPVPQHVLIDRVIRALERQGAQLRKRCPNTRDLSDPGAFAIRRPVRSSRPNARRFETYPGTLEELARELGVLDARERLVP
ncbi:hypothetical protein CKO29_18275 [Allochromatium vinosum]|uniref:Uncharacterized protein n=2 Tax=Allochromatium TaxID=85072 RepID=A0A850RK20_9GAMM|nr:hypothetical protein [Allochromatium humboldtianum]MBK1656594.1 hypothetical protein [Allochromatium vinosum]NVZ11452.1 hypothetical protein [Allochromatium humboldtianum]